MSVSETVDATRLLAAGDEPLAQADLSALLAEAIKLYVARSSEPYGDEALAGLTITPTEACVVAAALLHSQSLSPFEFSVWFSTTGR